MRLKFPVSRISTALISCSLGAFGLAVNTYAQNSEMALEEVIVTAQKREQNVQDVAIAVTAFSGSEVAPGGIQQFGDIAVRTPGFYMTQFNLGEPQLYVRGIGNSNDSAGGDPAVGVFIAEV